MSEKLALVVTAAALGLASGCTGSRRGGAGFGLGDTPWSRPVQPPAEPAVRPGFATGRVTSISADGLTIEIEIERGTASEGDPVTVVLTMPYPSLRNFADEVRERRVATARVVKVDARHRSVRARIVPDPRNARVVPGDKVLIYNL